MYAVHLRLIGKLVGDFLLVIIELFFTWCFRLSQYTHLTDGRTDGRTDVDIKTVRMHSQSHCNKKCSLKMRTTFRLETALHQITLHWSYLQQPNVRGRLNHCTLCTELLPIMASRKTTAKPLYTVYRTESNWKQEGNDQENMYVWCEIRDSTDISNKNINISTQFSVP